MSKKLYPEEDIQNIANAIRNLNGSSDTYTVSEMASAVALPENGYYLKESASANPLSITDGEELNAQSCEVSFEPIQDLNGYDSPWIDSNVINKEPYLMRAVSGTAIRIGNSLYDTLVGGTVAFNQLVNTSNINSTTHRGVTFTVNAQNNTVSVAGQIEEGSTVAYDRILYSSSVIVNHVYFYNLIGTTKADLNIGYNGTPTILDKKVNVFKPTSAGAFYIWCSDTTVEYNDIVQANIIDLTQMFGSTIADYIYSLEQATAGSGVAYFKSLFPKDYYDYNAGQLMSVKALSHKMVGFNQWDEEWENGTFNTTTGVNINTSVALNQIRVKNLIKVVPNTTYYFNFPMNTPGQGLWIIFYDENNNVIPYASLPSGYTHDGNSILVQLTNRTITIPSNCVYIRFYVTNAYGNTYKNDICINLHWDGERDGEYEAYSEHIYPLDSDLELRGIPKLDSNNKLYYDGDTYESDGTVTRKYGVYTVDNNTEFTSFTYSEQYGSFARVNNIGAQKIDVNEVNVISTKAQGVKYVDRVANTSQNRIFTDEQGYIVLRANASSDIQNVASLKTYFMGCEICYELATPTTETADTFQNPQVCDEYGTEEYSDSRTVQIPVGHETYQANICEISGWDGLHLYQDTEQTETPETTHTATFHNTVYGGEYDFVSGEGKEIIKKHTITSSEVNAITTYTNIVYGTVEKPSDSKARGNKDLNTFLCDQFVVSNSASSWDSESKVGGMFYRAANNYIYFGFAAGTTEEQVKTALNGVEFTYELATPTEIELTPADVNLLKGLNTVWTDGDTVQLEYWSKSLT